MGQRTEQIKNLENSIERIDKKLNKIMFYLPSVPQASGGIGVVYSHVKTLTDLGYNAMVIHDDKEYKKPEWLGKEYCDLKHFVYNTLTVGLDDILVIPEGFSNIMENTKQLPCKKVVLCQSYLYILSSLVPGYSWLNFGINDVIVVQKPLQDYIEKVFGAGKFNFQICRPSIDEKIFKPSNKLKKPIVAVSARDQADFLNMAKHFYSAYPQYRFVSFKDMRGMTRNEFAEVLQESFLGVWIDRVAGFGTFPVEAAKCETPVVGLVPNIIPEYAKDSNGVWINNILDIPDVIANVFSRWFTDEEIQGLSEGVAELAKEYTREDEIKNIELTYSKYINSRKEEILNLVNSIKTEDGE